MYLLLTGISSIRHKNGLSIMSTLSVDAIKTAVLTNDIAMLSKPWHWKENGSYRLGTGR